MKTLASLCALVLASGCAHDLTVEEHEAEAVRHQNEAAAEQRQYDPTARTTAREPGPSMGLRGPFEGAPGEIPPLMTYNPTEVHLDAAESQRHDADSHLKAAAELERFEDAACAGVSKAERAACPLLAPKLAQVEETSTGILLHVKPGVDVNALYQTMSCHMAFARAHGYDSKTCPLYLAGVSLSKLESGVIELRSNSAGTAATLRKEARAMFGAPAPVSAR